MSSRIASCWHAAARASDLLWSMQTRSATQIGMPVPRRGQRDAQSQTAVAVARRHDVSAVRFDDGTVDGQPHAEPLGLARDEGLEHALELRPSHAGAGIGNRNLDAPRLRLPRLDAQYTGSVHDIGHGL